MKTTQLCLITVIAETVLKERIIAAVRESGSRGFTVTDAAGEGSRQRHVSEILGDNFRLETIVSQEVADRIFRVLSTDYFDRYAVIAYLSTVNVIRGEKYV